MRLSGGFVLAGLFALGGGFVYGFVVAEKRVFPYRQIQGLWRLVASPEQQPPKPAVEPRMETGWWEVVRQPGGPSREDILRDLDALGYLQSYHAAEDEYGITLYDRELSQPGHNLIVSAHEPSVLLADMEGQVLHTYINVGRGEVVQEAALVDALRQGEIAGAALDVFETEPLPADSPLWLMPQVIISPHMSGDFEEHPQALSDLFIENFRRYRGGEPLLNVVDKSLGYIPGNSTTTNDTAPVR